jgi:hypothetical protein
MTHAIWCPPHHSSHATAAEDMPEELFMGFGDGTRASSRKPADDDEEEDKSAGEREERGGEGGSPGQPSWEASAAMSEAESDATEDPHDDLETARMSLDALSGFATGPGGAQDETPSMEVDMWSEAETMATQPQPCAPVSSSQSPLASVGPSEPPVEEEAGTAKDADRERLLRHILEGLSSDEESEADVELPKLPRRTIPEDEPEEEEEAQFEAPTQLDMTSDQEHEQEQEQERGEVRSPVADVEKAPRAQLRSPEGGVWLPLSGGASSRSMDLEYAKAVDELFNSDLSDDSEPEPAPVPQPVVTKPKAREAPSRRLKKKSSQSDSEEEDDDDSTPKPEQRKRREKGERKRSKGEKKDKKKKKDKASKKKRDGHKGEDEDEDEQPRVARRKKRRSQAKPTSSASSEQSEAELDPTVAAEPRSGASPQSPDGGAKSPASSSPRSDGALDKQSPGSDAPAQGRRNRVFKLPEGLLDKDDSDASEGGGATKKKSGDGGGDGDGGNVSDYVPGESELDDSDVEMASGDEQVAAQAVEKVEAPKRTAEEVAKEEMEVRPGVPLKVWVSGQRAHLLGFV